LWTTSATLARRVQRGLTIISGDRHGRLPRHSAGAWRSIDGQPRDPVIESFRTSRIGRRKTASRAPRNPVPPRSSLSRERNSCRNDSLLLTGERPWVTGSGRLSPGHHPGPRILKRRRDRSGAHRPRVLQGGRKLFANRPWRSSDDVGDAWTRDEGRRSATGVRCHSGKSAATPCSRAWSHSRARGAAIT